MGKVEREEGRCPSEKRRDSSAEQCSACEKVEKYLKGANMTVVTLNWIGLDG